jgi:4-hydroxy-tetrahydrodipicolinate synthase
MCEGWLLIIYKFFANPFAVNSMNNKTSFTQPLKGIIPPMVTPLLDNRTLDKKGLDQLIEHLIGGGVHGIFILGTTGESTSISYALRRELIFRTCEKTAGRIPILVGVTDSAPEESISLSETAQEAGAAAVVAAPPYYFGMEQGDLVNYYHSVAERSPLPLLLYNMPSHTNINIETSTVKKLSEHPNIIGIKDSSGNAVYFNSLLHTMRDDKTFTILVGPEEMLVSTVLLGGDGGVNGGANMFPRLYVDLYEATVARDFDKIIQLQEKVMTISEKIYHVGDSNNSYLQGLKAAMAHLNICSGFLASPLSEFDLDKTEIIKANLKDLT